MITFGLRMIGLRVLPYKGYAIRFERQGTPSRNALSGILLSMILLIVSHTHPLQVARQGIFEVAYNTQAVCERPLNGIVQSFGYLTAYFQRQETLLEEIHALRQQNENLLKWQSQAQQLAQDQQRLKAHLKLTDQWPYQQQTVRVLGSQSHEHGNVWIISAGHHEGLRKNHVVVTPEGLLGRVIETGLHTSRVLRLTDVNARVPVKIAGGEANAMLSGRHEPTLEVSRLAQQTNFNVGDVLVTSGEGGIYPAGIPVATVTSVNQGRVLAKPITVMMPDFATVFMTDQDNDA